MEDFDDLNLDGDATESEDTNETDNQVDASTQNDDTSGSADSQAGASTGSGEKKRRDDLMSKWQKAESRADKLEERLKSLETGSSNEVDPKVWADFQRTQTREQIYTSEPRFKAYGMDPSVVEGDTPTEMQASLVRMTAIMDRIETDASNAALVNAGITPELKGKAAPREPDIPESLEDFEALVASVKAGA
jgi:hypothetical protein